MKNAIKNKYVQAVLRGVKPCVTGIVLATGAYMTLHNALPGGAPDIAALCITALLCCAMYLWPKLTKKKLSPIALICVSAVLGILVYSF